MQQILWFEIILKGLLGTGLFLVPGTLAAIAGLHRIENQFWPRIAGALLIGLAACILVQSEATSAKGAIGPAGLVAINLAGASGLLVPLILGTAAPTKRGRVIVLLTTLLLAGLAFVEIAYI